MHGCLKTAGFAIATSLIIGIQCGAAFGAAWTREEGSVLLVLPTTYTVATEQFDADGNKVDRPSFDMVEFTPLAEFGLTDYLTVAVQPKYRRVEIETPTGKKSNSGLPEVDALAKVRLWHDGDAAFSIQGLVKIPVSPEERSAVALGRDQYDVEMRSMFGNRHRLDETTIFYNLGFAFRKRFEEPSDEVSGDAFIGWATGPVSLIVHSLNTVGLANDATDVQVLTAEPDFRKHAMQLTGAYRFSDEITVAAGASKTYAGTNVGAGYSGFLSALFRF